MMIIFCTIFSSSLSLLMFLFPERSAEMEECLTEINNCMTLIMPDHFNLFSAESTSWSEPSRSPIPQRNVSEEEPCCSTDQRDTGSDPAGGGGGGARTEEQDEESDDGDTEEGGVDADMFIRNTGLMSRTYRLDLNISTGEHEPRSGERGTDSFDVVLMCELYRQI